MLSEKPWKVDALLRLWLAVFMCLLTGMLVGGWLKRQLESDYALFVVGTISFHWAALVLVHFFLREHQSGWREGFGFNVRLSPAALLFTLLVAAITVPVAMRLGAWSALVLTWLGLQPEQQALVTTLQTTRAQGSQIYMSVMAVSVVPATEEILFRGILYPFFRQRIGAIGAGWIVAALFGVMHANLMAFVSLMVLGLALAWIYERTGNLLAPIAAHSLFNLANLFLMTFGRMLQQAQG